MNTPTPIQISAELISNLASELKRLLKARIPSHGLHFGFMSLFTLHTIRQVKAICLLVGFEKEQYYAEQAGQLVRNLCELYAKLAWMIKPNNDEDRDYRAWQLEKSTIDKEPISDDKKHDLYKKLGIVEYESNRRPIEKLPHIRYMFREIESPEGIEEVYKRESSTIHLSRITLMTNIYYTDPETLEITVNPPNTLHSRALRLYETLILLDHIAIELITGFQLDIDWEKEKELTRNRVNELLVPMIDSYPCTNSPPH